MLSWLNHYIFGPLLPILLILSGGWFALYLKLFPIRHPIQSLRGLFGRKKRSSMQSMMTALAGTLGVGNITGVACAITAGGAGSIVWMWISAIAACFVKYAETVLACKYRSKNPDGTWHGSASEYIKDGMKAPRLASFFSILLLFASFAVGNMTQSGAAAETAKAFFGIPRPIFGILFSAVLFFVICGGAGRIVSFANRLIPPLTGVYILLSVIILVSRAALIPNVLNTIFVDAFTPRAGISGFMGYLMMPSLRFGTARGILSNEAGCGTAPTAHAASGAEPAEQGLFGIFEVTVDTLLLCTLTAFVVLLSGSELSAYDGTELALRAFSLHLGDWVMWVLSGAVMLYALASTVAWAYYGMEALRFLRTGKTADRGYRLFYALFGLIGAILPMTRIFDLCDVLISLMTLINVICLIGLGKQVKEETVSYFAKKRRC